MKKALGIYLISLIFIASGCASKVARHDCPCESKKVAEASSEMKESCCGSDNAGHNHAGHDHKNCKDGSCDLKNKAKN